MTPGRRLAAVSGFHGLRAFRHRNYRLFFLGQSISLVGTWMQSVAQAWLILSLTGDPFILGLVSAAQFGPILFLGLFGGLIADAFSKRRILLATQVAAMLLAFAMFALAATDVVQPWMILVLALGLGLVNAFEMPTRQSFTIEMVGREGVGNAVGLNAATFNVARIIGPAIAGLTIAIVGIPVAFLINGLSFLAVIAAYGLMREDDLFAGPQMARPTTVAEVRTNLGEGLRYVRTTPIVLLAIATVGVVSTFGMNFGVMIPSLARLVLDSGSEGYGFLMSVAGIGSLVASLATAFAIRTRPERILIGAALLGVADLVLALSRSYPISLVTMFFVGLGGITMAMTANTTIQLLVPDHLRGRVMSVHMTAFVGSTPIGGLLMGTIASAVSVPAAMSVGGAGSLVAAGIGYLVYRRIPTLAPILSVRARSADEDDPDGPPTRGITATSTGTATRDGATTGGGVTSDEPGGD